MPSRASHTAANNIQIIARLNSPSIANLIELNPKLKPDSVIKFGKSDLRFIFFIGLVQCCKHTFSGYNFVTNFAIYSCIQGHVNIDSRSKSN